MSEDIKYETTTQENIIITFANGDTKEYKDVKPTKKPDITTQNEETEAVLMNDTKLSKFIWDEFHYRFTTEDKDTFTTEVEGKTRQTIKTYRSSHVFAKNRISGIELKEIEIKKEVTKQ